jgi:outer membrane protein OmpA-like peptidoglycan-associated protein
MRGPAFAAALVLLGWARPARSDPTPSLTLDPAPAGDRGFVVERAGVHSHLGIAARLFIDYAREPLVLKNALQHSDVVITDQVVNHALASFSIFHRALFDLDVPFLAIEREGALPPSGASAERPSQLAHFGDIRLGARAKLVGSAYGAVTRVDLAAAAYVWFPSATDGYAGDGSVRGGGALIVEGDSPRLYWALSAGARSRPGELLPGALPTRVGHALTLGTSAGFYVDARRHAMVGTEAVADVTFGADARLFDPRATTAHLFVTGHYRIAGGPFEIGAAIGPGIGQGAGSGDVRALALFGYAREEPEPPPDADDDGIPDESDACVELAGVPARDPLLHGCPEPPPDFDGDAIPDEWDACPRVPGEPTGERRTHGCPPDTDRDGVPDVKDACPNIAGVPPPKGNGCPVEPPKAEVVEEQIVISQKVEFAVDTAQLLPESDAVLAEVVRALEEHPDIARVEVQGHTDDTGTAERNRELGQQRAEAVVAWLVAHGVAPERLSAKGYGTERPIADNSTEEGRTKNRRVEFRILERRKPEAPGGEP